jgi:exosortase/archaeosortase family protein
MLTVAGPDHGERIARSRMPFGLAWRLSGSGISDRALLIVLLLGLAVAGWPSLGTLLALAQGDTPVSFVPLVPVLGAILLVRRCDVAALRVGPRDGFVDGFVLLIMAVLTAGLLLLAPVMMSWDYWLDRLDIPGLILLLSTLIVALWGLPGLAQFGPGLLYMLFAWPFPYLLLYGRIIPSFTSATAHAARLVAPLLPLGIRADSQDASALLVTFHGQTTSLVVAQACAGVNGLLGLVVIGLPIALIGKGSWEARGSWLLIGAALSWVVNVLRIVLIAVAAVVWGPDNAMQLLHPELGLILFMLSFALLLWIAPLCGLDIAAPWRARRQPIAAMRSTWPVPRLLIAAGILVAGGALETNFSQFGWVSESSLPRIGAVNAGNLVQAPPDWRLSDVQPLAAWQPLFGSSSLSAVSTATIRGQAPVYIQAVLTADEASFRAYGVEDCYTFHGFVLRSVHRIALGSGVTATLIDFQTATRSVATLYWLQPVQTPQGLYHERIVLIGDASAARPAGAVTRQAGSGNAVQRMANAVDELFSPWFGGDADPRYTAVNASLERFGQAVIALERHGHL